MGSINSTAKLNVFGKVAVTKPDVLRIAETVWDGISAKGKEN
jgi:hypothetical protein